MPLRKSKQYGCLGCIISLAITIILLLFLTKSYSPTCSIEEFDIFTLKRPTKLTPYNNTIHYDLKLKNRNINKGVYYDALNITFYYKPNRLRSLPIGNATLNPFYQGHRKSAHRVGAVEARGVNWENSINVVTFRVELATAVRYKTTFWKTKRRHLVVGADLKVNDQGILVKGKDNKGIKLTSRAERNCYSYSPFELLVMLSILIFIHS